MEAARLTLPYTSEHRDTNQEARQESQSVPSSRGPLLHGCHQHPRGHEITQMQPSVVTEPLLWATLAIRFGPCKHEPLLEDPPPPCSGETRSRETDDARAARGGPCLPRSWVMVGQAQAGAGEGPRPAEASQGPGLSFPICKWV